MPTDSDNGSGYGAPPYLGAQRPRVAANAPPQPAAFSQPPVVAPQAAASYSPGAPQAAASTYVPASKPAPQFDANNPATWGSSEYQTPYKYGDDDMTYKRAAWNETQSGSKPWLTNDQGTAETRNNYYYGGNVNGAQNFNNQIGATSQGMAGNFASDAATANGLNAAAGGLGTQAGLNSAAMAGRNPGQFLDQQGMANNGADRGAQLGAIGSLNQSIGGLNQFIANGPGPSAAQAQLNMATDANTQNALALARSGRGLGQSQSAMRQAIGQNAATQQQSANQSAVLRAQEAQNWQQNQLGAYGQLGNLANAAGGIATNARAGDLGQSSYLTGSQQNALAQNDQTGLGYAGLQQQYGSQQLGAAQLAASSHQADAASQLGYLGLQNNVNSQNLGAAQNYEQGQLSSYLGQLDPHRGENKGTDYSPYLAAGGAIIGGLVGGPGGAAAGGAAGGAAGRAIS